MITPFFGGKEIVHDMLLENIPWMDPQKDYEAIAFVDDNKKIIGGTLYTMYTGNNIEGSIFSQNKKWANRLVLRSIFWYPFKQLQCARLTATTPAANSDAIKALKKMGFKHEGTLRSFYPDSSDSLIFGMLKNECRWIKD